MLHSQLFRQAMLSMHFIGLAFGLGGAAIADLSFVRAVRLGDRITVETVNWMRKISDVVWLGMGILTLSGVALFARQPSIYLHSAGFRAKMLFVAILIVNGLFLNFYTTARLTTFNFSSVYTRRDAAWKVRKLSFIFGAISTVTWYATLFTAEFKGVLGLSFAEYVIIYLTVLGLAIGMALLMEYWLHRRAHVGPRTIDQLARPAAQSPPASLPVQPAPPAPMLNNSGVSPLPTNQTAPSAASPQTNQHLPPSGNRNIVVG